MSINVFEKLLIEKIENFKSAFAETAEGVFFNDDGKLIHPGEFGRYRENICKQFLKFVTPARLDIGTGFIINTSNEVSHQCDIIIYDAQNTPLLESEEKQFFFPVETIAAVGEIKSVLSKKALSEAIQKLEKIRPVSLGQASRISGVSPADISVLVIYLENQSKKKNKED